MSDELMVIEGKTQTGQLDFKMAAAACYLPFSFIHLIAAGIFLATEPKEHRFVRFHAIQSLLVFALLFGGSMVCILGGMMILPAILVLLGSVLGGVLGAISRDLGDLFVMVMLGLSAISYIGGAILGIVLSLGFLPAMGGTMLMVATGSQARWPLLGRMADRFA
ncbi:MAG: hypothetical protein KC621_09555 [Myxococcales bacterium]|nr:hypothetical protein [Myxococcales bacterium]